MLASTARVELPAFDMSSVKTTKLRAASSYETKSGRPPLIVIVSAYPHAASCPKVRANVVFILLATR